MRRMLLQHLQGHRLAVEPLLQVVERCHRRLAADQQFAVEHALADYAAAYGLGYAALRYFNAAGASFDGDWPALAARVRLSGFAQQFLQQSQLIAHDGLSLRLRVPIRPLAEAGTVAMSAATERLTAAAVSAYRASWRSWNSTIRSRPWPG